MATRAVVETRRDRKALVADAGYKPLSLTSALAGVLTAYGAFALLAGIAVGVIKATNVDIDLASHWRGLGMAGGLVVAGLLLAAYFFGGYVAGRMARRSGTLHGVVVFVLGVAVAAGAAWLARQLGGADVATDNLRDLGIPTTASEWGDVATVAGIASLAAMLVGAVAGGALGERWHAKLVTRALDPRLGAEAEALRDAERRAAEAEELRTGSFQRVRTTTPTRTRRADRASRREPNTVADRDGDATPARIPQARAWSNRPGAANGSSFWWRRRSPNADSEPEGVTGRPTAPSAGRTG